MQINFSLEMEDYIREKAKSGRYGNVTEVVQDAVGRMHDEDVRRAAFLAAIKKGEEQIDRGEGIPYTPELLEEITREALDPKYANDPIDPDVLP